MCHLVLLLPAFALPLFWIFPLDIALPLYAVVTGISFLIYFKLFQAMRREPQTGQEAMLGTQGVVLEDIDPEGKIQFAGEVWDATTTRKRFSKGELVRIASIRGLMLLVEEMPTGQ
jgi:membrane protein implicated in regulation of membrane protease activity